MDIKNNIFSKISIFIRFYSSSYLVILGVVTIALFANSVFNGYNYDDTLVTQNQPLTANANLSSIQRIFTEPYYKDSIGHSFGYRPMVLLSFAIEHSLFSESPFVSHFINVLFYLIAVFLFFNLLRKFIGEDKLMIAFLASLIFVVHPVHSEVVASIKNRDEILAFLFAMLSGLMAIRYLEKKIVYSILFSFLFFTAAMLSKKSIFPLAIVFPLGLLFLKGVNKQELSLMSLSFIVPGAIIGSDFVLSKFILLLFLPSLAIVFGYYINSNKKSKINKNELLLREILLLTVSWGLIALAVYKENFGYVFLSFVVLSFLELDIKKNIFQMMLQLMLVGYFMKNYDCFLVTFIFSGAFVVYNFLSKKNDVLSISVLVLSIIGLLFLGNINNALFLIGFVFLFFYLSFKNAKFSLLLAGINLIISFLYFQIGLFQISLLVFAVTINFNFLKTYFLSYIKMGMVFSVFASLLYISFGANYIHDLVESLSKSSSGEVENIQTYLKNLSSKNQISEGRRLEYMENTLVAPHTLSEKVATGFIVLGEYARLMVFPKELSFYYGYSKIKTTNFSDYKVWIYLSSYLILIFFGIYQINKKPLVSIGIAWYVLSILLFSNWVELVAGMVGERLAFTASAGFSVFIAAAIYELKKGFNLFKPQKLEWAVLSILLLFSVRTFSRNTDWQSPVALMTHDIVHIDNSAQANNMLALSLMNESMTNINLSNENRLDYQRKAEMHFSKAISIYPYFFNYHFDLGRTYVVLHDFQNAKKSFFEAFKLQPENLLALDELTKICFDLGNKEETVRFGNLFLEINPYNEKIHEFVSYICLLNKDFESTKKYAERGLNYFPNNENFKHMIIDSSR